MRILRAIPILSLIFLSVNAWGKNAFQVQEERVQQALQAMYNRKYDHAKSLFELICQSEPFHPMGPMGSLATQWYIDESNRGYQRRNEAFLPAIDKALGIYAEQMRRHPQNPELVFFYGTTMGLKARLLLGEKNYFGVLISGYQAIRAIKDAERRCPDLPDFRLPSALFSYYVGISAPYMKIASWILNVTASRDSGLQLIEEAALRGNYSRYEARALLAYIYYYFEGDWGKSLHYSILLASDFPDNPYYAFLSAAGLLQLMRESEANFYIQNIRKALPTLKKASREEYEARLLLLESQQAFQRRELATAEKLLKTFIDNYHFELDFDLGNAWLYLGNLYDLQKRRQEARACYRQVIALNNRSVAVRLAEKYLEQPFQ